MSDDLEACPTCETTLVAGQECVRCGPAPNPARLSEEEIRSLFERVVRRLPAADALPRIKIDCPSQEEALVLFNRLLSERAASSQRVAKLRAALEKIASIDPRGVEWRVSVAEQALAEDERT